VLSKEATEPQKYVRTADTRKLRGNATVRRLACSVAWDLRCNCVGTVSSICAAPLSSTCSTQADNNSRKLRLPISLVRPRPNCRPFTCYMSYTCNVSYVPRQKQASSLSFPCVVSIRWAPIIIRCGLAKCGILYKEDGLRLIIRACWPSKYRSLTWSSGKGESGGNILRKLT
jgi:hypothetical protein